MDTYLPYIDFTQAIDSLLPKELCEARITAYHTLRLLQHTTQPFHYQLSGGDKGTIVENANGTYVGAASPVTQRWARYFTHLIIYYNTILIITERKDLKDVNNKRFKLFPLTRFSFSSDPKNDWLTPEYCKSQREYLIKKDEAYSEIF